MSYVDAGYVIALVVLAVYSVGLVLRRQRLNRAAGLAQRSGAGTDVPPDADAAS